MFSSNCLLEEIVLTKLKKVSVFLLPHSQARLGHSGGSFPGEEQGPLGDANPRVTPMGTQGYGSPARLQLCADGPLSTCPFETALV